MSFAFTRRLKQIDKTRRNVNDKMRWHYELLRLTCLFWCLYRKLNRRLLVCLRSGSSSIHVYLFEHGFHLSEKKQKIWKEFRQALVKWSELKCPDWIKQFKAIKSSFGGKYDCKVLNRKSVSHKRLHTTSKTTNTNAFNKQKIEKVSNALKKRGKSPLWQNPSMPSHYVEYRSCIWKAT